MTAPTSPLKIPYKRGAVCRILISTLFLAGCVYVFSDTISAIRIGKIFLSSRFHVGATFLRDSNPNGFWYTVALYFAACIALGIESVRELHYTAKRFGKKMEMPNQSSDPAFASGTSRAGHETRHR
jgi:hypothetical protein